MFHKTAALAKAREVYEKLLPHVDIINFAGGLRREKTEVHDIEVVLIARREKFGAVDLFGMGEVEERVVPGFVKAAMELGKIVKGQPSGRMMQILSPIGNSKIILDVFMPASYDYFRQYCIRTGSSEYVKSTIATGWRKQGWVAVPEIGLRREQDCEPRTGADKKITWILVNKDGERPPMWASEKEFYDFIKVQWLPPKQRTV